jgi:hypothetical protein
VPARPPWDDAEVSPPRQGENDRAASQAEAVVRGELEHAIAIAATEVDESRPRVEKSARSCGMS